MVPQLQELVSQWLQSILRGRYPIIAITYLTFYDWIISVDMEVEVIHKAQWTFVKTAYLLCRYYPMVFLPLLSWAYVGNHEPGLCPKIVIPLELFLAPLQIFPQAVMVMRVVAFTGRSKKTLVGLSLGYTALVAVNIWVFSMENTLPPTIFYQLVGPTGCFPNFGTTAMALRMSYVMIAATLMDGMCLGITLLHFFRTRGGEASLLGRFFVLQALYTFFLTFVVNVIAAVLFFLPNPTRIGIGVPLFLGLPNLIACRLVLQLRRRVSPTDTEILRRHSKIVNDALAVLSSSDRWLTPTPEISRTDDQE